MTAAPIDVRDHERLVHFALRRGFMRHVRSGRVQYDDLAQAGRLALMRAAADFDPARGCTFATYAMNWLRAFIGREVVNHGSTVRVPAGLQERRIKARQQRWPVTQSLDTPAYAGPDGDSSATLGAVLPDESSPMPDEALEAAQAKTELADLIERARLSARELRVVRLRSSDVGLAEIAAELEISRERARQLEREALEKLRRAAGCSHVRGSIANTLGASRRRRTAA